MVDYEHSRTVPAISMTTAEIVELDILANSPIPNWYPIPIPDYMTGTVPHFPPGIRHVSAHQRQLLPEMSSVQAEV